jgi:hypothetical protein
MSFKVGDRVEVIEESFIKECDGDIREIIEVGLLGTIVKPPFGGDVLYCELWFDRSGPHSIYGVPANYLKLANPLDRLAAEA